MNRAFESRLKTSHGGRKTAVGGVVLLLLMLLVAGADTVPADAFPGIDLDVPLQDQHATGEALVLKGRIRDSAKEDGQILFKFAPQSGGGDVRAFISLQGTRFEGYHIFQHDQAGTYDLEVFLGGAGDTRLDFVGRFDGLRVTQGSGPILLPGDFFAGVVLDAAFPTEYRTGEEVALVGRISDPVQAGGQILFDFVPRSGGEDIPVFIDLEDTRFDGRHVFRHGESGIYDLEVFLGGSGEAQLDFIGRFPVAISQGTGTISIPSRFFPGLVMDRPLPTELPVGLPFAFSGQVEEGIRAFRIELASQEGGEARTIAVGVEDGRFGLPLRLRTDELGDLEFRIVVELEDGRFRESGVFLIKGVEPPPAPRLETGVLALSLLAGGSGRVPLFNRGEAGLERLRYEVEGPFQVAAGPQSLAPGARGEALVQYDGPGGEDGLLRVLSDDPLRPVRRIVLRGVERLQGSGHLPHLLADGQGGMAAELDFNRYRHVLVLYSAQLAPQDTGAVYSFAIGGSLPAARLAAEEGEPLVFPRDRLETALRQREQVLAAQYREHAPPALKPAAGEYQVGDRRTFAFPDMGRVPAQKVSATVVSVDERAVAWVQDDLRPNPDNLTQEQIRAIIEPFSRQDYALAVGRFGAPSDVDGDGKLSFLFTHLVDDVGGVYGFYSASAVVPQEVGGDGNLTDMMFISPAGRLEIYRALLVHEFQHLINFNQHVLVRRGEAEVGWLNEGLSHLSEDLVSGHAVSGQSEIVSAFLRDPSAAGLGGEARLDPRKRGAAYLFVRSLVDRMGEEVLRRLVGTGLADRDNVEEATGEDFGELLAFWGTQVYASGLGLNGHRRLNYDSPLLRAGEERGFPLPAVLEYPMGGMSVVGILRPRGLAFVRVQGRGVRTVEIHTDPEGEIGAVFLPLPRDFLPEVRIPGDYVPGLTFSELVPGVLVVGREYPVAGTVRNDELQDVLFRFVGPDTVRFEPEIVDGEFSQKLKIDRIGEYELQVFTGTGGNRLDFAGGFGPVWVVPLPEATAVVEEQAGLPGVFALGRSYPNPFNASSVVPVAVPENAGEVVLEVFDVLGQRVRVLHRGVLPAGWQHFVWDGRDEKGKRAASGVYWFQLCSGDFRAMQPAVLLR